LSLLETGSTEEQLESQLPTESAEPAAVSARGQASAVSIARSPTDVFSNILRNILDKKLSMMNEKGKKAAERKNFRVVRARGEILTSTEGIGRLKTAQQRKTSKQKSKENEPVSLCTTCEQCVWDPDASMEWVGCDSCDSWWMCDVCWHDKLDPSFNPEVDNYRCPRCTLQRAQ